MHSLSPKAKKFISKKYLIVATASDPLISMKAVLKACGKFILSSRPIFRANENRWSVLDIISAHVL